MALPKLPGFGGSSPGTGITAAAPLSSIQIPGFTPDYAQLIASDPAYLQLKAAIEAAQQAAAATRKGAVQKALVGFGTIPGSLTDPYGDVDETTRALAAQSSASGLSTQAQIDKQHRDNLRRIQDVLAARGILSSGETGYQVGEENLGYAQTQNEALQELLEYLAGAQAAFTGAQQEGQESLGEGAQQAAEFQSQLPQNQPTDPFKAAYNSSLKLYQSGNNYYTSTGQLIDPKVQAASDLALVRKWQEQGIPWAEIKSRAAWRRYQLFKGM